MPKKPKYYVRPDGLHETIRTVNGKRVAFRGRTDAEVERKMIEYQGQVEQGRHFKEIAEEWEAEHFPTLAPNSLKNYAPALKDAINEFGDTPIKQIQPSDVTAFLESLKEKQYARKTVDTRRLVTNMVCSYAVRNGDLGINPCRETELPKGLKKTYRQPASKADEKKIKDSSPESWLLPYLILYTGLRRGEACGLKYEDIDLKKDEITVCRSVYYKGNKAYTKEPKSQAGYRKVSILKPLKERLPKGKHKGYLFSMSEGKTPLSNDQYQKLWETYQKEMGVSCTAHQLRHSYASMLHECNVDMRDAQYLLGHSTIAMTQDVYTHIREDRRKDVAKKLNAQFDKTTAKKSKKAKSESL